MGLQFNGSTQYATASDAGFPAGNAPRTLMTWFQLASATNNADIVAYGTNETGHCFSIGVWSGTIFLDITGIVLNGNTSPWAADTNRHHLVASWDGAYIRLYLDGINKTPSPPSNSALNTVLNTMGFGIKATSLVELNGTLWDTRIYNRVLSDAEIKTIYNTCGVDKIITGLLGRWVMLEKNAGLAATGANSIIDWSGRGAHATPVGSPLYKACPVTLF